MENTQINQHIDQAAFLSTQQKEILKALVPQLSNAQQQQLVQFIKTKNPALEQIAIQYGNEQKEVAEAHLQQIQQIKHRGTKTAWNRAESSEDQREASVLSELENQLEHLDDAS